MAQHQRGFALLMSMVVLVLLSIVVLNSVRTNVLNERMSGAYMERTRAFQAAEQALQQGKALLMANTAICYESSTSLGCSIASNGAVTKIASGTALPTTLPSTWSSAQAVSVQQLSGQVSSGQFTVTRIANTSLPKVGGGNVSDCKAYSIMGRGVGLDASSVVLLQAVSWLCPA